VTAESEGPGRGSAFTVTLPITTERHVAEAAPAPPVSALQRVLLIEDNRDAREMFRIVLEMSGHEVLEAAEGRGGIELVKTRRPDVAVIDIGLPGLDGYEVARQIRADPDLRYVRLIALTGYGLPEARERSREAGFDHHLVKPVAAETLLDLMRSGAGSPAPER
jgi:CheY-like chemotaxis protein